MMVTVDILGTPYTIIEKSKDEDNNLVDCDGYCDWTTKQIVIERELEGSLGDMELYIKKVKRHEIVHAFLRESGLDCASHFATAWGRDEEIVDWIAIQGLKIYQAWQKAGAI